MSRERAKPDRAGRFVKKSRVVAVGAGLTVLLVGASIASGSPRAGAAAAPGVSSNSITIGGTFPLTGPASAYKVIPAGMGDYFQYINAKGGVNGRQINWKVYDDAFNPAQTVQFTRQLVEQDKAFAVVGSLGTAPQLSVRPYLNQGKVPQLFPSTQASYWTTETKKFPYTSAWAPDYIMEGRLYGKYILANKPNAKIGVLYQNDPYGLDYLNGLKQGLGKKAKSMIVSAQGYEITATDVRAQMSLIKDSGADTLFLATTPAATVRAYGTAKAVGYKPSLIVLNSVAAIESVLNAVAGRVGHDYAIGTLSAGYAYYPTDPRFANVPAIKLYQRIAKAFGDPGINTKDITYYYGIAKAYDVVKILQMTGKNPTRDSVVKATREMNWINPFMLPGVKTKTGPGDTIPYSQLQMSKWNGLYFKNFGKLLEVSK